MAAAREFRPRRMHADCAITRQGPRIWLEVFSLVKIKSGLSFLSFSAVRRSCSCDGAIAQRRLVLFVGLGLSSLLPVANKCFRDRFHQQGDAEPGCGETCAPDLYPLSSCGLSSRGPGREFLFLWFFIGSQIVRFSFKGKNALLDAHPGALCQGFTSSWKVLRPSSWSLI